MPTSSYRIGECFAVQFAWQLPIGDYIRAVFQAEVLDLVPKADKYVVSLTKLIAGRQESAEGEIRPTETYSKEHWSLVGQIVGKKVSLAYEVDDGRALHLRLATLTGEHDFFRRFDAIEEAMRKRGDSTKEPPP